MAIASVVLNITGASTADSKAVVALADASTAIVNAGTASTAASTASVAANTADSKASVALVGVASAIGSEPGSGEFAVTDIKRSSNGSIVFEYNDSAY